MKALLKVILGLSLITVVVHAEAWTQAQANQRTAGPTATSVTAPVVADFVLFSSVKVKPESVVAFKQTVLPYADLTRKEEGCLEYRVHQSPDDPTQFETYEHWASNEARAAHLAAPYTVEFFKAVASYFEPGYPIRQKFIELR